MINFKNYSTDVKVSLHQVYGAIHQHQVYGAIHQHQVYEAATLALSVWRYDMHLCCCKLFAVEMEQDCGVTLAIIFQGAGNNLMSELTNPNYPQLESRPPTYGGQLNQAEQITQEMADSQYIQGELRIDIKNDIQLREPDLGEFKYVADSIRLCRKRYKIHTIAINPSTLYPTQSITKYLPFIYSLIIIFGDLIYISDNMDIVYLQLLADPVNEEKCTDFFNRYVIQYQQTQN